MNRLPKISIITPSYNQGEFLEEAILSVLNQGYPSLEYIVIDGGSTDNSVEIIKSHSDKITYWVSEKDNGQSDAINKGLSRATGDIVAWLNSDDLYIENCLWHVAEVYQKYNNDNIGIIIGNGYRYKWETKKLERFCPRHICFNYDALRYGLDYILQPSTFIARKAIEKVGLLRENLHFAMDWEWWYRIANELEVVVTDKPLSMSREYNETKTSSGGFKRWNEIRTLSEEMTQEECTPGALFYFFETLNSYMQNKKDNFLFRFFDFEFLQKNCPMLQELLYNVCGSKDGFPIENSEKVTYYIPYVDNESMCECISNINAPKITIVTPSYNQGQFLEKTINSVLDQNYPNLEYIIVDGGSTDNSVEIIKKYADKLAYWVSEKDNGPAEAINKGLKRATGEIIAWLNSDDCLSNNSLWEIAKAFNNNETKVVYGHALYIDENDIPKLVDHGYQKTKIYFGYQQSFDNTIKYWNTIYMVPQPTTFFKKELIQEYGFLDEEFKYIFDYEYFLRFTKAGIQFHLIDRIQAFYRIHDASKTAGFEAFLPELYRYSRKYWGNKNSKRFSEYFRDYFKYYLFKIKQFYSNSLLEKVRLTLRMIVVLIQTFFNIGNPEKHFAKLTRK